MTTPASETYVPLFGRRVPVQALTLLLRLEDEGFDVRVDAETRELCIKPTVPASERQAIARYKPYLVIMVEGTMQLLADEQEAERDTHWSLS